MRDLEVIKGLQHLLQVSLKFWLLKATLSSEVTKEIVHNVPYTDKVNSTITLPHINSLYDAATNFLQRTILFVVNDPTYSEVTLVAYRDDYHIPHMNWCLRWNRDCLKGPIWSFFAAH
jgi:hypothetical protein